MRYAVSHSVCGGVGHWVQTTLQYVILRRMLAGCVFELTMGNCRNWQLIPVFSAYSGRVWKEFVQPFPYSLNVCSEDVSQTPCNKRPNSEDVAKASCYRRSGSERVL